MADDPFGDLIPQETAAQADPFSDLVPQQPERPGVLTTAGQALSRGLREGLAENAAGFEIAGRAATGQPAFQYHGPEAKHDDPLSRTLAQPFSEGWSDPNWWTAQIVHGMAKTSPSLAMSLAGGAAGTAIEPGVGTLVGGATGFGAGALVSSLAPSYQRAREEGLDHDAAVDRALKTSGVAGAFGAVMGLAPGASMFGKTAEGALKKPVSEALAQIFAVQPGIGAVQQVATQGGIEGKPVTAGDLLTGYATNVGSGLALTAGHRALDAVRPQAQPAPATERVEPSLPWPAEAQTPPPAPIPPRTQNASQEVPLANPDGKAPIAPVAPIAEDVAAKGQERQARAVEIPDIVVGQGAAPVAEQAQQTDPSPPPLPVNARYLKAVDAMNARRRERGELPAIEDLGLSETSADSPERDAADVLKSATSSMDPRAASRAMKWARENNRPDVFQALVEKASDYALHVRDLQDDLNRQTSASRTPPDMMAYIRARGGIKDTDNELKVIQAHERPGIINNKSGLDPDHMRSLLVQEGYLRDEPYERTTQSSLSDFYSAIDDGLRGKKIYRPSDEAAAIDANYNKTRSLHDEQMEHSVISALRGLHEDNDLPYGLSPADEADIVDKVRGGLSVEDALERQARDWYNEVHDGQADGDGSRARRAIPAPGGESRNRPGAQGTALEKGASRAVAGEEGAGGQPALTFTTAYGSTYSVHGDGTTSRYKAARDVPGHEGDSGAKPRTEATYYVKPEDANRLAFPPDAKWRVIDHGDGTISVATQRNDGKWGIAPSQRNVPVTTKPEVGATPVELWGRETVNGLPGYKKVHFGNEIVDVGEPRGSAVEDLGDGLMFAVNGVPSRKPARDNLGYVSQALEAAHALKQAKGTPEQMLAQLRSAGVKQAEIDATKLADFMAGKKSVTRDEIVRHLEDNRVTLNQKQYGDPLAGVTFEKSKGPSPVWQIVEMVPPYRGAEPQRRVVASGYSSEAEARADALSTVKTAGVRDDAKWRKWAIDGENPTYRETVLHLGPMGPKFDPSKVEIKRNRSSVTQGTYEIFYDGKKFSGPYSDDGPAATNYMKPDADIIDAARRIYDSGDVDPSTGRVRSGNPNGNFQSGHWSEPNVIAHARTSVQKDSSGRPVFLVDELQSDWGQKLRDGGARDDAKIADLKRRAAEALKPLQEAENRYVESGSGTGKYGHSRLREDIAREMFGQSYGDVADPEQRRQVVAVENKRNAEMLDAIKPLNAEYARLTAELNQAKINGTPGHPLVNTTDQWTQTAFRRLIKQAVDSGADAIALTPGKVQVDRFNLAKHISNLEYIPATEALRGYNLDGQGVFSETVPREKIKDYVGSEIAERLLSDSARRHTSGSGKEVLSLDTEGLTVGGEGMKHAYDVMYPKMLQKMLQKIDPSIKPETRRLTKHNGDEITQYVPSTHTRSGDEPEEVKFVSFPITDKVRSALGEGGEGLPMFAAGADQRAVASMRLTRGETYSVPEHVPPAVLNSLAPLKHIVPRGTPVGTLIRLEPGDFGKVKGTGEKADTRAVFLTEDGKEFSVFAPRRQFVNTRAIFDPDTGGVGFVRMDAPRNLDKGLGAGRVDDGVDVFARARQGELLHEVIHLLRRSGALPEPVWTRMLNQASALRILDSDMRTYLQAIGNPAFKDTPAGVSVRDVYERLHKGRRDMQEMLDQEAVTHMAELYHHDQLLPQEVAPVKSELEDLMDGKFSRAPIKPARAWPKTDSRVSEPMAAVDRDKVPRDLDPLGYYSGALEAARNLRQAKGTPEQMLAMLTKEGAKKAEIEATGLDKFLAGKSSVTKDEIAAYLEQNRVGLKETQRTGERDALKRQIDVIDGQLRRIGTLPEGSLTAPFRRPSLERRRAELSAQLDRADGEGAKFSSYSLDPFNPTYRETVLHLPGERITPPGFGHFDEPNITGHMMTSMTRHEGKPVFTLDQIQSDWGQKLRDGGVRDEAKIADLRKRHDDLDAQTEKVLDEAVVAFAGNPRDPDTRNQARAILHHDMLKDPTKFGEIGQRYKSVHSDYERVGAELGTSQASSPGHPLVNTTDQWTMTTLRRAIRQAVEAGADYIAIPHGDTVLSYNPGDEHGMRSFYGSRDSEGIVPKNLRKMLEKIDRDSAKPVKVEKLETSHGLEGWQYEHKNQTDLEREWGTTATPGKFDKSQTGFTLFPLTEQVKDEVLGRGQPMFALNGVPEKSALANDNYATSDHRDGVIEKALRLIGLRK